MNTYAKSQHAVKQDKPQFLQIISNSASATLTLVLIAMGLLLAVPCARATTTDQDFILAAVQGGMTEVKLGELAAQNGKRDDVKDFGQMMVKDHTAINDDLKTLAAQKGVTLPDSLDAKHQAMADKMAALTGSEFDDAYLYHRHDQRPQKGCQGIQSRSCSNARHGY